MTIRVIPGDVRSLQVTAFRRIADAIEGGASLNDADVDQVISVLLAYKSLNPRLVRKLVLRRYWRKFYPGADRCRAANLIAVDWKMARTTGFVEPGSRDDFFQRLAARGISRVAGRTIIDDLDDEL